MLQGSYTSRAIISPSEGRLQCLFLAVAVFGCLLIECEGHFGRPSRAADRKASGTAKATQTSLAAWLLPGPTPGK